MRKSMKIEARTISFIRSLQLLKERRKMPSNKDLASIMGIKTLSTISEIKAERQNIQPDSWIKFMRAYKTEFPEFVRELEKQKLIKNFDDSGFHTFHEAIGQKNDLSENTSNQGQSIPGTISELSLPYGNDISRLLTMLEKEQDNVRNAHDIIRILASKVTQGSNDPPKEGFPPLKTAQPEN